MRQKAASCVRAPRHRAMRIEKVLRLILRLIEVKAVFYLLVEVIHRRSRLFPIVFVLISLRIWYSHDIWLSRRLPLLQIRLRYSRLFRHEMSLISVLSLTERGHLWLCLKLAAHLIIFVEDVAVDIE